MSEWQKGLVSIVVPTYFSEKYLKKCLQCIVKQTYPDIEVIVVDGGSEDGTMEIIHSYAEQYDFIRCIQKKKEGVSASRNRGMEAARGEYLEFVDSDDFLMPNACETLVKAIRQTGADVVTAGFTAMKTGEKRSPVAAVFNGADEFVQSFGQYYSYKQNCLNVPWNKIYRRETLCAEFPKELSMGEDLMFNLQVFEKAEKLAFIPELVYQYNNVSDESLAYRYRENGFKIETMLHEAVLDFVARHGGSCDSVLYGNYLFVIKAKITALVHKSGLSCRECCCRIREWTETEAMKDLTAKTLPWGKKDKVLLFMLRHHMKNGLYWYYRLMA